MLSMRSGHVRVRGKWFAFVIVFLLIVWPVYQIYSLFGSGGQQKGDASQMLYEVGVFQMGLLQSALNDAVRSQHAAQLNGLKLSVYSANYTHERLVKVFGPDHLRSIQSFGKMLEYITTLQIGGDRPLTEGEQKTLQSFKQQFGELYTAYEQLLSSGSQIVGSANDKIIGADKQMTQVLEEQLKP